MRIRKWIRKNWWWYRNVRRLDAAYIPPNNQKTEIRLFTRVRNEALRLPYFFKHYRDIGVDRFFVIDHESTDGSANIALEQSNTHVFSIAESYKKANHGTRWIQYLLDAYGEDHWCLVVDADELLMLPQSAGGSIHTLCRQMQLEGTNCLRVLLLDIFSKKTIRNTTYQSHMSPLNVVPYFEPQHQWYSVDPQGIIRGGMRARVFDLDVMLTKHPFFYHTHQSRIQIGMHFPCPGLTTSTQRSVLLHTKFLQDFPDSVTPEIRRGERWNNSSDYKFYQKKLRNNEDLMLWNKHALTYKSVEQVDRLGLLSLGGTEEML